MFKKFGILFSSVMILCAALSGQALAASTVSSVTIDICPEVEGLQPGEIAESAEPEVTSGQATIYDYQIEGGARQKMRSYYYNVTLMPNDGYEFSSSLSVTAKGGSKVQVKKVNSTGAEVRITTYPFFRLENPTNIEERDDGDGYKWKKVSNAKKYNVVVYYENEDGDEKKKTQSVSTNKIEFSSSFMDDNDITGVSVQAVAGSTDTEYKFILPSEYVTEDDSVDDEQTVMLSSFSFPSSSDKKGSSSSSSKSSSSSTKKSASTNYTGSAGPSSQPDAGWVKDPNGTWFKNPDGTWPANEWKYIKDAWYWFKADGYMATGWAEVNGAWYCFASDGKMYSKCWTPDGFYVDESGAWQRDAVQTK